MDAKKDISITTTKEIAEACGYMLIGARNRMAAIRSSDKLSAQERLYLTKDYDLIDFMVTAFAGADIVSDRKPDHDPLVGFQVVEYVGENAERHGRFQAAQLSISALAAKVNKAGGTFTIAKTGDNSTLSCCEVISERDGHTEVEDICVFVAGPGDDINSIWSDVVNEAARFLGILS